MWRGTAKGREIGMAVIRFGKAGDLKLPDIEISFWYLFPTNFTVQELQMLIMLTQYFWLVTMFAIWNGPLNGWVISIEKVLNVGHNLWTIRRNTQAIISEDFEEKNHLS